jgi:hypothetical protein
LLGRACPAPAVPSVELNRGLTASEVDDAPPLFMVFAVDASDPADVGLFCGIVLAAGIAAAASASALSLRSLIIWTMMSATSSAFFRLFCELLHGIVVLRRWHPCCRDKHLKVHLFLHRHLPCMLYSLA